MIIFYGEQALTSSQAQKLQNKIGDFGVQQIHTQYIYFMNIDKTLSDSKQSILDSVLHLHPQNIIANSKQFIVIPIIGTISPWSSKASDIISNCGININSIERGVVYSLVGNVNESLVSEYLFDKMTQQLLPQDIDNIFISKDYKNAKQIDVLQYGKSSILKVSNQFGFRLSEEEIDYLVTEFQKLCRNPYDVELMMFAQINSEHCRHKIFNASWELNGVVQEHSLFAMIKNTYNHSPTNVLSAYKDNAAIIQGFDATRFYPMYMNGRYKYTHNKEHVHILMKVETHNHPTAISPFAGAATGSGGEIRDEGATGRGAKPKAGLSGFTVSNLRIPGFTQSWEGAPDKPRHIASPLEIMLEAPLGSAAFNNEFGRAALSGYFRAFEYRVDDCHVKGYHKPIMLAGGIGNIKSEHIEKCKLADGDLLIVIGGPAMLIGLGGGAASSTSNNDENAKFDFASVQRDNPEMERRAQELLDRCWALGENNPIQFIHDVGAGGLSNAMPELIHDGGVGGNFYLRKILVSEIMSPLEIWCNEAQERYVLSIKPSSLELFDNMCARERCPYAVVGVATAKKKLTVNDDEFQQLVVDMPLDVLLGKFPQVHKYATTGSGYADDFSLKDKDLSEVIERVLSHPTVASKKYLITIGDRSITGMVAAEQMVGAYQVPVGNAAVTTSTINDYVGEAMAIGERSPVALLNAKASARLSVAEAITNIVCTDIANINEIKLSANWMAASSDKYEDADLFEAVQAIGMEFAPELDLCIPVGKDSLSMTTNWHDDGKNKSVSSPLSVIISAFAPVQDARLTLAPVLQTHNNSVLLLIDLGHNQNRIGGSIAATVYNKLGSIPADCDNPHDLKNFFAAITELKRKNLLLAYHDVSDGGLLTTVVEMSFASRLGIILEMPDAKMEDINASLFSEELGAVVQIDAAQKAEVLAIIQKHNLLDTAFIIGSPQQQRNLTIINTLGKKIYEKSTKELEKLWARVSLEIQKLRDNPDCAESEFSLIDTDYNGVSNKANFDVSEAQKLVASFVNTTQPKIAVLREQGTNGHVEMAAAFNMAGFEAYDVHMTDLQTGRVNLREFQAMVACGGFSFGDVLGAGSGWANSILFNQTLSEQFQEFFHDTDKIVLGICNGCQMLSQLKYLIPGADHIPNFMQNSSERFESRFAQMEILPSPSIFFQGMHGSILAIPVAHGEGRVVDNVDKFTVARYVDGNLQATEVYPLNPNGSRNGGNAFCNEDGRVTIMMPHPERSFLNVQQTFLPAHKKIGRYSPWFKMFTNARLFFNS